MYDVNIGVDASWGMEAWVILFLAYYIVGSLAHFSPGFYDLSLGPIITVLCASPPTSLVLTSYIVRGICSALMRHTDKTTPYLHVYESSVISFVPLYDICTY
jgi:hypothetical protein